MTKKIKPSSTTTENPFPLQARVGYSDFIRLCRIEDPDDHWPWLSIKGDGVYVKEPDDPSLTHIERATISEHPSGNLKEPALRFPCTLPALQEFLEEQGANDSIYPFDMADWLIEKIGDSSLFSPAPTHATSPDKRAHISLLCITGALAEEAKIDLSQPYKAGQMIERILTRHGIELRSRTIGDHLKGVADAMDSRKRV